MRGPSLDQQTASLHVVLKAAPLSASHSCPAHTLTQTLAWLGWYTVPEGEVYASQCVRHHM